MVGNSSGAKHIFVNEACVHVVVFYLGIMFGCLFLTFVGCREEEAPVDKGRKSGK